MQCGTKCGTIRIEAAVMEIWKGLVGMTSWSCRVHRDGVVSGYVGEEADCVSAGSMGGGRDSSSASLLMGGVALSKLVVAMVECTMEVVVSFVLPPL